MSESWGHAIRALTRGEQVAGFTDRRYHRCCAQCHRTEERRHQESSRAFYSSSFRYRTGRAGRIGERHLYLCETHAEKFAQRYGLKLPRPEPTLETAPVGWGWWL